MVQNPLIIITIITACGIPKEGFYCKRRRTPASQHTDPQPPEAQPTQPPAETHLGGCVVGGSAGGFEEVSISHDVGEAKVSDLDVAFGVQQQVFGFKVSVNHHVAMAILHTRNYLRGNGGGARIFGRLPGACIVSVGIVETAEGGNLLCLYGDVLEQGFTGRCSESSVTEPPVLVCPFAMITRRPSLIFRPDSAVRSVHTLCCFHLTC